MIRFLDEFIHLETPRLGAAATNVTVAGGCLGRHYAEGDQLASLGQNLRLLYRLAESSFIGDFVIGR